MTLRLLLSVTVLAGNLFVGSNAAAVPVAPGCHETKVGYTCFSGPYDVGSDGLEILEPAPSPDSEGYITFARAALVSADGDPVSVHKVHLHHAVWVNTQAQDVTCDSLPGDRFFASGKERTPMNLPEGYGYHWANGSGSKWWLAAHLDGMHGGGEDDVYIKLRLGFTTDPETIPILPVWIDVNGSCTTDPTFDVPKSAEARRFRISDKITMPIGGRFIGMAGHLHDGGLRLKLRNLTKDRRVFTSEAVYGEGHGSWFLTKMTSFYGLPGKRVAAGDRLKLTAVYNSTRRRNDAMGIMMGALVPN